MVRYSLTVMSAESFWAEQEAGYEQRRLEREERMANAPGDPYEPNYDSNVKSLDALHRNVTRQPRWEMPSYNSGPSYSYRSSYAPSSIPTTTGLAVGLAVGSIL